MCRSQWLADSSAVLIAAPDMTLNGEYVLPLMAMPVQIAKRRECSRRFGLVMFTCHETYGILLVAAWRQLHL